MLLTFDQQMSPWGCELCFKVAGFIVNKIANSDVSVNLRALGVHHDLTDCGDFILKIDKRKKHLCVNAYQSGDNVSP